MQLVPIIPQPKVGVEESLEVKGVAAVKPSKPVMERTLPPSISYVHAVPHRAPVAITQHEKRQLTQPKDRRLVCRRFQYLPVLQELRSAIDRRKHNQRNTDFQLHIDEQA